MDRTDAQSVVVEAESWQRALQAARTARGEKGPISGFSIELLDEGYRAVDPLARLRFDVKRAAPDAPLTDLATLGRPAAPAPPLPAEDVSADATISVPAVTTPSSVPPPLKKKSAPPPPPPAKPAGKKTSSGKMKAAPVAAPTPMLAFAPSKTDGQNHHGSGHGAANGNPDATIRTDAVRFDGTPRFEPPTPAAVIPSAPPSEPSLPVPATQIIFKREHDPTERLPLTYREYVFTVARGVDEAAGERLLRTQLGLVRASIAGARPGKFVNLAVFDTVFQGRPPVPPLATLAWKDWRGEPQVIFPRRGPGAAPSSRLSPPAASPVSHRPPPPSVAPPPPAMVAPPQHASVAPPPPQHVAPASVAPPPPQHAAPAVSAPPMSVPPPAAFPVAQAPAASAPPASFPSPVVAAAVAQSAPPQPVEGNPFTAPLAPAAADPFAAGVAPLPPGVPVPAFGAPALQPPVPSPAAAAPSVAPPVAPLPEPAVQAPQAFAPPPSFAPPPAVAPPLSAPPVAAPAPSTAPAAPAFAAVAVADPFGAPPAPMAPAPVASGAAFPAPVPHGHASATGQHRAARGMTPNPSRPSLRSLSGGRRPSGDELIASLFEAMHELNFARDVIEGGDYVLSLALDMIPSRAGIVHLYDIDRREYVVACAAGPGTEGLLNRRHLEGEPLLANAMRKRRALVFTDSRTEESVIGSERFAVLGGATSVIVSPVMKGGRFIGVIELLNPLDGIGFTDEEGNAIDYLAEQFGEFVATKGMQLDADRITRSVPPPG